MARQYRTHLWSALVAATLSGCNRPEPADTTDTAKVETGDTATVETGDTATVETGDTATVETDGVQVLDSGYGILPVGADVVFDGASVWVAWNRRDGAGRSDVLLQRWSPDGQAELGPLTVTDGAFGGRGPTLAVSDGRLMVAWTRDDDGSTDIVLRAYDLEGEPLIPATVFEGSREGLAVTGDALFPDLAARDGGFWLAGSWVIDVGGVPQVFAVRLDLAGVPVGDAVDGGLAPKERQEVANIVEADDGEVRLKWTSDWSSVYGGPLGQPERLSSTGHAGGGLDHGPSGWWTSWSGVDYADSMFWVSPDGKQHIREVQTAGSTAPIVATEDGALLAVEDVGVGLDVLRLDAAGEVVHTVQVSDEIGVSGRAAMAAIDDQHVVVVYGVMWPEGEERLVGAWVEIPNSPDLSAR